MAYDKPMKFKKPPSCDRCKGKRVLCHPAPPGQSCPRCVENRAECITTPVIRRKPTKKGASVPPSTNNSFSPPENSLPPLPLPSFAPITFATPAFNTPPGASPDSFSLIRGSSQLALDELPKELLLNLFETFRRLPQRNNPIVQYIYVRNALDRVNWRPHLLPLDQQALVFAIAASAALISIHPAILGDGPLPATPQELESWPLNTDWGEFGRRRESACVALREEALRLAREADVTTNTSEVTASVCYLLDALLVDAGGDSGRARPFAVAYITHARTMAERLPEGTLGQSVRWSSFFATEAVRATHANRPILFSKIDQQLLHGDEVESLDQLEAKLSEDRKKQPPDAQKVFGTTQSYGIHAIDLARALEENICGSFAKRRPLDETKLNTCITALTRLSRVHHLLIERLLVLRPTPRRRLFPDSVIIEERGSSHNTSAEMYHSVLQSIRIFASMCLSAGILTLHLELQRRARESPGPLMEEEDSTTRRARERVALVRNQVKEMVREAARDLAAALDDFPSLPHCIHFRFIKPESYALVLLEEVQEKKFLSIENAKALESLLLILRIVGFSYNTSHVQPIINAIEHQLQPPVVPPLAEPLPLVNFNPLLSVDLSAASNGMDLGMGNEFVSGMGGLGMDDWFSSALMGMSTPGLAVGGTEFVWPDTGTSVGEGAGQL